MSLWTDIEACARAKLGLPEYYQMCDVKLLPHGDKPWKRARVAFGIKLPAVLHPDEWADVRRVTIKRTDLTEGGSDDTFQGD